MAWTEEQKAQGRAELLRRRTRETATTYRKTFFAAVSWCLVCLLTIVLAFVQLAKVPDRMARSSIIYVVYIALIGLAVTATLSYVRYLDWRRKSVSENEPFETPISTSRKAQ
jgi:membrane protein YdbS with pleckstrin-like domain